MKQSLSKDIQASLIIPLFNNEKTLVSQLKRCEQVMQKVCSEYEIIVCEDKSTDSSANLLRKYFLHKPFFKIKFHTKNQGIATTIMSLYKQAEYKYIVLFSVDGDWLPNDIGRLLMRAKKADADIVIGKRPKASYSLYRQTLSFFYNLLPLLLFQVNTVDTGSIKVIKRELIHSIPLISQSTFFEGELIIRAAKMRKKIINLPIYFQVQKEGKSRGAKIALVAQALRDIIVLRFRM